MAAAATIGQRQVKYAGDGIPRVSPKCEGQPIERSFFGNAWVHYSDVERYVCWCSALYEPFLCFYKDGLNVHHRRHTPVHSQVILNTFNQTKSCGISSRRYLCPLLLLRPLTDIRTRIILSGTAIATTLPTTRTPA